MIIFVENISTMKNLFKKTSYTFLFLFALIISLIFSSCGDKNGYTDQIKNADSLFKVEKFKESKVIYAKALQVKKDEIYPKEQIKKIDAILSKRLEDSYSIKIKEADAFLSKKEYSKAKRAYAAASVIKPNETYPKTKINEITKATAQVKVANANAYHIIAGSYAIQSNATKFQKSLTSKGRKSTIIRSRNGNYLVSLKALETITKAYNYRNTLKDASDASVWVYKIDKK